MKAFLNSCENHAIYPQNCLEPEVSERVLCAYTRRLENLSGKLFVQPPAFSQEKLPEKRAVDIFEFHTRDHGHEPRLRIATDLLSLKEVLRPAILDGNSDPLCRFISIYAQHSRAALDIFQDMFTVLLSYHQVSPSFLDFVFTFGSKINARDFHYSGLREESRIGEKYRGYRLPELGRSGREIRLCYNFRSVEESPNEADMQWSIRQCATYQSYDLETGNLVWIDIKANDVIKKRIKSEISLQSATRGSLLCDTFSMLLSTQLILCDWSGENWRWYINDLEDRLHEVGRGAIAAPIDRLPPPTSEQPKDFVPPASPLSRASTFRTLTSPLTSPFMKSGLFSPKSLSPRSTWEEESHVTLPTHTYQDCNEGPPPSNTRQMRRKLLSMYRRLYNQACNIGNHILGKGQTFQAQESNKNTEDIVDSASKIDPPELPPNFSPINTEKPPESLDFSDLQKVHFVEEKAHDVSLHLKFNIEVLEELRQYYSDIAKLDEFPNELKEYCRDDLFKFDKRVLGLINEMRRLRSRTDNLRELTSNRKQLVKGIIEHKSVQANEYFAKKAQQSADNMEIMTRKMRVTAEKTERETVSMRVITSVTLFFLPATFLASFMSTDILSFEKGNQELRIKGLWLYLELALPATALTFIVWGIIYHWAKKASKLNMAGDDTVSLPA